MINKISINNFKSIRDQVFEVRPLTILVGTNSSGKSTFLQSILLFSYYSNQNLELEKALAKIRKFKDVKCFYEKGGVSILKIFIKDREFQLCCNHEDDWSITENCTLSFEDNLYYISSNRVGQEDIAKYSENIKFGVNGQNIFGFFENHKNKPFPIMANERYSKTLAGQLRYWMDKIFGLQIEFYTEDIDGESVRVGYKSIDTSNILSTFNVGSGISYAVRILIVALSLKKGDVFLIENPEIHLHPKAVANLTGFFSFLVSNGVQLIIETHSEHVVNKVRHCVYRGDLGKDNVIMYYKSSAASNFDKIFLSETGKIVDENSQRIKFSEGFFDANKKELMELI